jgi:ABC-type transport system substrate-binding protein
MRKRLAVFLALSGLFVFSALLAQPAKPPDEEFDPTPPKLRTDLPPVPLLESGERPDPPEKPINLPEEAKLETDKNLKQLLLDFAQPHDIIRVGGKPLAIAPLPRRSDKTKPFAVDVELLHPDVGVERKRKYPRDQFESISHFEINAIEILQKLVHGENASNRIRRMQVAEMIAHEVLVFHTGALKEKQRTGDGWEKVEEDLRRLLLRTRTEQLDTLTSARKWNDVGVVIRRLKRLHPTDREVVLAIHRCYIGQANEAIERRQFIRAREALAEHARRFGREDAEETRRIEGLLQTRTRELIQQAEKLTTAGSHAEALFTLEEAQDTWPTFVGLPDLVKQARFRYPMLRVEVKHLPSKFWPTTAETDADRAAVQLLFEPLLQLRAGPSAREGYVSKLGAAARYHNGELEITLPEGIAWADGSANPAPLTSDDVRRSLELLGDSRCLYYEPLASEREKLFTILRDSPSRLRIQFARAPLDPYAWLTTPIVPASRYVRGVSPRNPDGAVLGTGPFVLHHVSESEVIFRANPSYRRPHAPQGPRLKEIRFVRQRGIEHTIEALAKDRVQIVLDLSSREAAALGNGPFDLLTPTFRADPRSTALTNPSVTFLAPNFRRKTMQDDDLRQAISFTLDREAILTQVFRAGNSRLHRSLQGPYPLDSWAYDPAFAPAKRDPYQPKQAADGFNAAKAKFGSLPVLSLRHAAEDEQAAHACRLIASQLGAYGLVLRTVPTPTGQLLTELAKSDPDFDLVYWRHDYPSEMLSLWPLFEPPLGEARGRNFMGYANDPELEAAFRGMHDRRDFAAVQRLARQVHARIVSKAILIPLWQLDRHVVVQHSVRSKRLHPLWTFEDVEEWELKGE